MKKYDFYEDPGHGWLKVEKKELKQLGIAQKITSYSYMRGDYVYLEEDCDVTTFANAKGITPEDFHQHIKVHISNNSSKIRNYQSYIYYTPEQDVYIEKLKETIRTLKNWNPKAIDMIRNASLADLEFWKEFYGIPCQLQQ